MPERRDEQPAFPDESIECIAKTIDVTDPNKRFWLARHLRDIAANVDGYRTNSIVRRPAALEKAFDQLERDCATLLRHLNIRPDDLANEVPGLTIHPYKALLLWELGATLNRSAPGHAVDDGSAERLFQQHLRTVDALRDAAGRAKKAIAREAARGQGGSRRKGDWALEEAIRQLVQLYEEVTGRSAGTSVSFEKRTAGGPLIRYLGLCLEPLGWSLSPDAIRSQVRRTISARPS